MTFFLIFGLEKTTKKKIDGMFDGNKQILGNPIFLPKWGGKLVQNGSLLSMTPIYLESKPIQPEAFHLWEFALLQKKGGKMQSPLGAFVQWGALCVKFQRNLLDLAPGCCYRGLKGWIWRFTMILWWSWWIITWGERKVELGKNLKIHYGNDGLLLEESEGQN